MTNNLKGILELRDGNISEAEMQRFRDLFYANFIRIPGVYSSFQERIGPEHTRPKYVPSTEMQKLYNSDPVVKALIARSKMFGGLQPFDYNHDDDGDVDTVEQMKIRIESLQKTIERLTKLQAINPEGTIFVINTPEGDNLSQKEHADMLDLLPKGSSLIVLPGGFKLEALDDQDLAEVGLQRGGGRQMTDQQAYDLMLLGYRR